jgi:hypothetical protein
MIMYAAPTADWSHDPPFVDASTEPVLLIELGSGTGLVALEIARTLARAGRPATIVMTDLPEVCPLLEETAKEPLHVAGSDSALMNETTLTVHQLAWGDAVHADDLQAMLARIDHGITHILCSDLVCASLRSHAALRSLTTWTQVYFPELLAPLLRTLLQLTVAHDPVLVISYKVRSLAKESAFWSALGLWFSYGPVLTRRAASLAVDSQAEDWSRFGAAWDEPMFVFVGRRRPESRAWTVPYDNRELLDGIGARGTNTRKGDDTFETLLFMALQEDP